MDPYERADIVSDQYDDWRVKNAYLMGYMGLKAGAFLQTFKEYPPSQTPASFTIDQLQRDLIARSNSPTTKPRRPTRSSEPPRTGRRPCDTGTFAGDGALGVAAHPDQAVRLHRGCVPDVTGDLSHLYGLASIQWRRRGEVLSRLRVGVYRVLGRLNRARKIPMLCMPDRCLPGMRRWRASCNGRSPIRANSALPPRMASPPPCRGVLGFWLLQRLAGDVEELGFVEAQPKQDGRNMIMVIGPHKKKSDAKSERAAERSAQAHAQAEAAAEAATQAAAQPSKPVPRPRVVVAADPAAADQAGWPPRGIQRDGVGAGGIGGASRGRRDGGAGR